MLITLLLRTLEATERVRREERGDTMVNWLVLTVGLAAAAGLVIALLRPAIQTAAERIVNAIGG